MNKDLYVSWELDSGQCEILEELMEEVELMDAQGFSMSCLKNMLPYTYLQGNSWLIETKYCMVYVTFFHWIDISLMSIIYKTHWK